MKLQEYKRIAGIAAEPILEGKREGMIEYNANSVNLQAPENLRVCYDIKNDVWLTVKEDGVIEDIMISCFASDIYEDSELETFITNRKKYLKGEVRTLDISLSESLVGSEVADHLQCIKELL